MNWKRFNMAVKIREGTNVTTKNYARHSLFSFAILLGSNTQAQTTYYLQNTVLGQPEFSECKTNYSETGVLSDKCDLLWYRLEAKLAGKSDAEQDEVVRQRSVILEARRLEKEERLAEQEKAQAAQIAEQERAQAEQAKLWEEGNRQRKIDAPRKIAKLAKLDFCALYGQVLRDELADTSEIKYYDNPHLEKMVRSEAKQRKIVLNDKKVKAQVVSLGMSICSMYASLGMPDEENRSVGSWGVHIQHVYGGLYVYTENGIITSWQD
jgi:hypothetical protein